MSAIRAWCNRRVVAPITEVIQGGITPSKLALSIALGWTAGVWPVVGTTSAIAVLFMMLFPVNGVIVQVVNLLLTAVDIALVPTFVSFGARMYSSGDGEAVAIGSLMTALKEDPFGALSEFKSVLIQGIIGWTVAAPFMTLAVYAVSLPACSMMLPKGAKPAKSKAASKGVHAA